MHEIQKIGKPYLFYDMIAFMFISVFDLFKIGIGPSSSHTMGPMSAAMRFLERLKRCETLDAPLHITATLYGSLAFTGKGHHTDKAITLGLLGYAPDTIEPDKVEREIEALKTAKTLQHDGLPTIAFDPEADIVFDYGDALPAHPNGMIFEVTSGEKSILKRAYYSIGGGFVLSEDEIETKKKKCAPVVEPSVTVPFAFGNANEMLKCGDASGLSIADMMRANERKTNPQLDIDAGIDRLWRVMSNCIDRGLSLDGTLPGGLKVQRRAKDIMDKINAEAGSNVQHQHICNEWLCLYAMAVNEENAAGGQVVTAPTNGAAGVIPAVLRYYLDFIPTAKASDCHDFLLTAAAIGGIIKNNASISGAEVGCQGEVGSASAMAAAGLCAVMGGTNRQIENAAEIALEHHLGMTCDPVGGLVQVPCIERNGLGAVKALTASSLALRGNGEHFIALDACIETMRQTGLDMKARYKETSRGGLAVNYTEC